eukprot:TRINITY_DN1416_c0_g1_i1.p1 TRINITY_DN1416_c0_g1~~TRINITY_DN1416_c0_g1_i1.p1  ORF type:complete len:423 (-),score=129.58 TRINITY_DN1416_c0_g1_i1:166-1434(-)
MATGLSAIFVLDKKGKILINRNYRGDVPMSCAERFIARILEEEDLNITPVSHEDGVTYVYITYNNLYLLAVTPKNANAAMIIVMLYKLVEVFKSYFGTVEEESIRDNFVIVLEILDEIADFGLPQTFTPSILKEYITQESYKLEVVKPPPAVTNAVSWRKEGIKYKKNEVFLDVVESVNLLVNTNGTVLRSEIVGAIKMKSHLSGMPELRLGLNDRVQFENTGRSQNRSIEMEDISFHQCVRLSRFENDHTISFIPPDGVFELMSYRLNTHIKPLIWVEAVVDRHQHSRIEYMVKAKSNFKQRSTANNVVITIPVPEDVDTPKANTNFGKITYSPEKNACVWKIKSFQGGREYSMRAKFGLPSIHNEEDIDERPPVTVKFDIPYFTVSGIQVRYLKIIERSGYQALPWVRYITNSGDYQVRI